MLALKRISRCFKRMDKAKNRGRYLGALNLLAGLASGMRQPALALDEAEAAIAFYNSDANGLSQVLPLFAKLAFQAKVPRRAIDVMERSLPLLGKEHPAYKGLIGLLVQLSRQANDDAREQQYTQEFQSLGK